MAEMRSENVEIGKEGRENSISCYPNHTYKTLFRPASLKKCDDFEKKHKGKERGEGWMKNRKVEVKE